MLPGLRCLLDARCLLHFLGFTICCCISNSYIYNFSLISFHSLVRSNLFRCSLPFFPCFRIIFPCSFKIFSNHIPSSLIFPLSPFHLLFFSFHFLRNFVSMCVLIFFRFYNLFLGFLPSFLFFFRVASSGLVNALPLSPALPPHFLHDCLLSFFVFPLFSSQHLPFLGLL